MSLLFFSLLDDEVVSASVRVKPGVRRSWALCTFREASAAQKCVGDGMVVVDVDGTEVQLKCKVRTTHKYECTNVGSRTV